MDSEPPWAPFSLPMPAPFSPPVAERKPSPRMTSEAVSAMASPAWFRPLARTLVPTSSSEAETPAAKSKAARPFSPVASETSRSTTLQEFSTVTLAPASSPEISNGPAPVRWTTIVATSRFQPSPDRDSMPTPFTVRFACHGPADEPLGETETRQRTPSTVTRRLPSGSHSRATPRASVRTSWRPYPTAESPLASGIEAFTGASGSPRSKSTG